MKNGRLRGVIFCGVALAAAALHSAEIIFPDSRTSYYSSEPIEIAVAGLVKDVSATVKIAPKEPGLTALEFVVKGGEGAPTFRLAEFALAPGEYAIQLDGKDAGKLFVATGVNVSPML